MSFIWLIFAAGVVAAVGLAYQWFRSLHHGALTLAADGTFRALELPVYVSQSPANPWPADEEPALLTGSGTWKIDRAGDQVVRLRIKAASKGYSGLVEDLVAGLATLARSDEAR